MSSSTYAVQMGSSLCLLHSLVLWEIQSIAFPELICPRFQLVISMADYSGSCWNYITKRLRNRLRNQAYSLLTLRMNCQKARLIFMMSFIITTKAASKLEK